MPIGVFLAARRIRRAPVGVLSLGVVITTLLVYLTLAVLAGLDAREERLGQRAEGLARLGDSVAFATPVHLPAGPIRVVALAGCPTDAPALLGIPNCPRAGEMFASTALLRLLGAPGTQGDPARAAVPYRLAGGIDSAALVEPDELLAVVGLAPALLPDSSIDTLAEPAPRAAVLVLATLVLVPALVLAGSCARVDLRRQRRRLETLALLGATSRQVRHFAIVDAMVLAVVPAALAVVLAEAAAGLFAMIPYGVHLFADDLQLPPLWAAAAVIAGPLVAAAGMLLAVRGSGRPAPPGTSRSAMTALARVAVLLVGVGVFVAAVRLAGRLGPTTYPPMLAAGLVLTLIGAVTAAPVLLRGVGWAGARVRFGGGVLVAARRLQRSAESSARATVGLVLACFVIGFISSVEVRAPTSDDVADVIVHPAGPGIADFLQAADRLDYVRGVAPVLYARTDAGPVLITSCTGLTEVLGGMIVEGSCREGSALIRAGHLPGTNPSLVAVRVGGPAGPVHIEGVLAGRFTGLPHEPDVVLAVAPETLAALPVADIHVRTDGSGAAEVGLIATSARTMPLSAVGAPEHIDGSGVRATVVTRVLRLLLAVGFVLAGVGLLVAAAESLLVRRPLFSILDVLGMTWQSRVVVSAIEVGVPAVLLALPALAGGATLSYFGGRQVGGDVRVGLPDLSVAAAAIALLTVCGTAIFFATIRRLSDPTLLRSERV